MAKKAAGEAKIPVVEQVAELAMKLSQRHMAEYGANTSRHDFTQRQLLTCLILRVYLKTTYRGVLDLLASSASLRARLGLGEKLPHFTTLQKFSGRSQVLAIAQKLVAELGRAAVAQTPEPTAVAMDATGLARTTVSDYFTSRRGRKFRRWVKVAVVVVAGSLLPAALAVDLQPTHDCRQARSLLAQVAKVAQPQRLYADAGYDAEWIHEQCREQWGVASVIPAVPRRADGTIGGKWRSQMTPEYLKQAEYNRRWTVESYFSALKRTMGSALSARRPDQLQAEAALKVLAYALRR
ncbi:MAG TPA: IS5 family transposase [Verrucomicrobiae bacterium]